MLGCGLALRHGVGADRTRLIAVGEVGVQSPSTLGDVVFLPLVGFDSRGVRLGTGGGFYDRAFAFRRWRSVWHTPRLIGLAYSLLIPATMLLWNRWPR